ncbi:methyltransferase domain-containing protein [Methanofollis ethanolicus]|uniref:methyltransferase domain-containing protein n=1 Tax=Methanofollis ethanolicus TaxID=488124 RepID=UPI000830A318|nr:methyltransferase domain-containing protein [Methanofollis ethanolicus]
MNKRKPTSISDGKKKKMQERSLGPVNNLEAHVPPEWWRGIFNHLYLKTDGDVVGDDTLTVKEIDLFSEAAGLRKDDRILDVCCGQGRHTLELARRGFAAEGLDRSHYLVQKARASAKKEGLDVRFKEGDARRLPYRTDTFDAVMILGNSFGYFESGEDDHVVLAEVARVLKPDGRILIDISDGGYLRDNFQKRSWEWIDKKHFVCRERSLSADGARLISREVITHVEKGVIADQFYAERLYTGEKIEELISSAGFSAIGRHGEIATESARNQDLGMMERRIVVTGTIAKAWTEPAKGAASDVRQVTVIFGDPRLRDDIKPDCVFDEDDYDTINRLKEALKQLKGYRFAFLDNHQTLIADLERVRSKTDYVFNLCDEGFLNDPWKELHVPALLEVLGIPYTGSAPQCLAFCYDKSLVRGVAREMHIPVPEAVLVRGEEIAYDIPFRLPAIVKPNSGDSSFGITEKNVAYSFEDLTRAISSIRSRFGFEKPILVEEYLTGPDLSVGIIGNPPESYTVLPIIEEDYSALPPGLPRICGYEAKWVQDSPYWKITSIKADLPEETEKQIIEWSVQMTRRLGSRDYTRLDWRLSADGEPKLLEVNPNPGWCWDGHLAKMAKIAGVSYPEMIGMVLKAAEGRIGEKRA